MEWKYIQNIDKVKDFAEMFIYNEISDEGINGSNFAYEMRYLIDYEKITKIKVRINSVGGDVMHAQSIISAIIDAKEKGVVVETYNDGLAASSAAVILCTAETANRYIKDYSKTMFHGVSPKNEANLNDNDRNALNNFKKTLVQILANRTGKKEAFFEELFTNGVDNWFDSKEMNKKGLIAKENIINTNVKVNIDEEEIAAGVVVVYNKLKTTLENNINQKPITMKKVNALLKLQEGVSEEVVEAAVIAIQNKAENSEKLATEAQNELKQVRSELNDAKTALEAQNKAAAAEFVKNCVKEGKISPEKEAEVLVQAENNLEGLKSIMSAIPAKANNILNRIEQGDAAAVTGHEGKTYRELEKNAPEVLNALRKTDMKTFVNLYNAQYNTQKTEADFQ